MLKQTTAAARSDPLASNAPGDRTPLAVECVNVTKQFPIVNERFSLKALFGLPIDGDVISALRGISMSVAKGQLVGVLGRNGAGKSTLLRVLAGVYAPSSGTVRLRGHVGSLFELGGLGNRFISGREYAERVLRLQGAPGRRLGALLAEIQDFAELGDFFERRIYTYSSGMAARLYFATATALEQDVYLIDEILSVGDQHFQAKCWRRIRERLTNGASGVLVTHDWSAVIKLCEESHVLDRGLVALSGPSDRVIAEYLRIPHPSPSMAQFVDLAETYVAVSGEDWELALTVRVLEHRVAEIAFSIEMLRLGVGWEIIVLSHFHPIASDRGLTRVRIRIPSLPLAPGKYSLNLFLRGRTEGSSEPVPCDTRSWTLGNGATLEVAGRPCTTVTKLPITWRARNEVSA